MHSSELCGTDLQLRLTSVDVIGGLVEFLQLPLEDMKQHSEGETGMWYNMWCGGTGGGMSNIWKQLEVTQDSVEFENIHFYLRQLSEVYISPKTTSEFNIKYHINC